MTEKKERYVFVKDATLSATGFASYESAKKEADSIEETPERRVRVRFRNRTGLWDVIVKVKQEAKEFVNRKLTAREKADVEAAEFISHHALTGE